MSSEENKVEDVVMTGNETSENQALVDTEGGEETIGQEPESYDYESSSKEELLAEIIQIQKENTKAISKSQLGDLKAAFDLIFRAERKAAFDKFMEEGGEKDGFDYQDRTGQDFYDAYKAILEAKKKNKIQQDEQRIANTKKKYQLLETLRELVDGEELEETFAKVKEIQKTWKDTGHVAQSDFHEMNANYHALLDRYYSIRSVYYDLKNLDRNKNLAIKVAIVEEAEKLLGSENTLQAVKDLNELHAQYKSVGPVPEKDSEPLWQRLKVVSDKIREERNEQIEVFKAQLKSNLELKKGILELLAPFESMNFDNIKEWTTQTNNIKLIQDGWKAAGAVPMADKKAINDEFWRICRAFYANKSSYFDKLDDERKNNLAKKKELITKVAALKDSENFKETAEKIQRIQGDWKKIGQAPRAVNESIYQEFRAECDHFFNRRSAHYDKMDLEFEDNYKAKSTICEKITKLEDASKKADFEKLVADYHAIGFVPRNKVGESQKQFLNVTNAYLDKLDGLDVEEIQSLKLGIELGAVKGTAAEKDFIETKVRSIRTKLSALNEEISTLNNNVEFFKHSKDIDNIRKDVDGKIAVVQAEVDKLKEQLKILNAAKSN